MEKAYIKNVYNQWAFNKAFNLYLSEVGFLWSNPGIMKNNPSSELNQKIWSNEDDMSIQMRLMKIDQMKMIWRLHQNKIDENQSNDDDMKASSKWDR